MGSCAASPRSFGVIVFLKFHYDLVMLGLIFYEGKAGPEVWS
jgi:hypothetical protein